MQQPELSVSVQGKHVVYYDSSSCDETDGDTLPPGLPDARNSYRIQFLNLEEPVVENSKLQKSAVDSPTEESQEEEEDPNLLLLRYAKAKEFEKAIRLLEKEKEKKEKEKEKQPEKKLEKLVKDYTEEGCKRTAAHYAAMTPEGGKTLLKIIEHFKHKKNCMLKKDSHQTTPLHYCMSCFSKESLKEIIDKVKPANFYERNCDGDTVFHFAAVNLNRPEEKNRPEDSSEENAEKCEKMKVKNQVTDYQESVNKESSSKKSDSEGESSSTESDSEEESFGESSCVRWIRGASSCCSATVTPDDGSNQAANEGERKDGDESQDKTNEEPSTLFGLVLAKIRVLVHTRKKDGGEVKKEAESAKKVLLLKNKKEQTVLHLAAMHASPKELSFLLKTACNLDKECLEAQDRDGYNFCHYAVQNENQNDKIVDELLYVLDKVDKELVSTLIGEYASTIEKSQKAQKVQKAQKAPRLTLLQRAIDSKSCKDQTVVKIYKKLESLGNEGRIGFKKYIEQRDKCGNTALILAAMGFNKEEKKYETASQLFHCTDKHHWSLLNNQGKSALHLAFQSSQFTEHLRKRHTDTYNELISESTLDGDGRSCLFYACMGWNFDLVPEGNGFKILPCTDFDKNTLLHALFFYTGKLADDSQDGPDKRAENFMKVFLKIASVTDIAAENDLGQNCLHASTLTEDTLEKILSKAASVENEGKDSKQDNTCLVADFRRELKKLLKALNGFHAIHSFASKYKLKKVAPLLAKLSDSPTESLLQLTVSSGPLKGATCLHFACETNNEENIKWLMRRRNWQALAAATHSGVTALDFAKIISRMKVVDKTFKRQEEKSKLEILCLIDPVHHGLQLPRRTEARQLLVSMLDKASRDKVARGKDSKQSKFIGNVNVELGEGNEDDERTDECILFQALDLDSPIMFRCALRLKRVTREVEARLWDYLQHKSNNGKEQIEESKQVKEKEKKRDTSLAKYKQLPRIHSPTGSSEMLVVDVALFLRKLKILPDLILTRQFELIPVTLSLLLYLRLEIANSEDTTTQNQLLELKAKLLQIAVNALECLYANIDNAKDKKLLMKYLNGKIGSYQAEKSEEQPNGNDQTQSQPSDNAKRAENPAPLGPKFPCRYKENQSFIYRGDTEQRETASKRHEYNGQNKIKNAVEPEKDTVNYYSVYEMVKLLDSKDIFATECIHRLVRNKWNEAPKYNCLSPKTNYSINFFAFIAFLVFFAWYLIDFRVTFDWAIPDVIMALYLASFTLQESFEIYKGASKRHFLKGSKAFMLPRYFKEQLNMFDCAAILFLWIGLVWKWIIFSHGISYPTAYSCQMVLSTAFLLWGFRSVSFLSYFETIGPVISMMRSLLLKDLLPFAAITIVIFYSSSVFFFNLLFSTVTATASERESEGYATSVFLQVFTLPFTLFLDNPPDYTESGGGTDQEIGSVGNKTGVSAFKNFFVFVFLIVVNIVMVNLLIALFSLRVSTMVSRARCIWRRKYFHLMQEFQHASPVPPPFSFIYYILAFSREVNTRKCKERQKAKSQEKEWWKSDGSSYPEDYLKFLRIQASCFSRNRADFLQQLEENQPDFDALKAFTRNSLAQMRDKLGETMDKQEEKLEGMNDSLRSAMLDRMNSLESKVDQLVQLISKS